MATINNYSHEWISSLLGLPGLIAKPSHLLLDPWQTVKTSLIRHSLKAVHVYYLNDTSLFLAFRQNPGRLAQEIEAQDCIVVVDEIQGLPVLLNEVHRLIETLCIRFLLTGSSARKFRRGGVNLLGGHAGIK